MLIHDFKKQLYDQIVHKTLFASEQLHYCLVPVCSRRDIERAVYETANQAEAYIFLNCGGNFDLAELLAPPDGVQLYVVDSRRPLDPANIYNNGQVICLVDKEDPPEYPEYSLLYRSDNFESEEDSDSSEDDSNARPKRKRFTEESVVRRIERRRWNERRKRTLHEYTEFINYSTSSAFLLFDLAYKLSKDNNDLLWAAVVGVTSQFLTEKVSRSKYACDTGRLQRHVLRLNHMFSGDDFLVLDSADCMRISVEDEFQLDVYRHWSLLESLKHTTRTACYFQSWTVKGRKKLHEFLVELGVPLEQCKQNFQGMDSDFRKCLKKQMEQQFEKHNLSDLKHGIFIAHMAFTCRLSACDVAGAIASLLESEKAESSYEKRFLVALDSLSKSGVDLIYKGIELYKSLRGAIVRVVQQLIKTGSIVPAASFLSAQLEAGSADAPLFAHPLAAQSLAKFLLKAFVQGSKVKRHRDMPLVLTLNYPTKNDELMVVGVAPVSVAEDDPKNLFGKCFETAAEQSGSRINHEFFDTTIVLLHVEDRERFFSYLMALLAH